MNKKLLMWCAAGVALGFSLEGFSAVPFARPDAMRGAALRDVRLLGVPAEKMNNFFRARMLDASAQRDELSAIIATL